ncbi:MAG TPA: hypothetical protein VII32_11040 [Thermoanaerobaculia bacterium]
MFVALVLHAFTYRGANERTGEGMMAVDEGAGCRADERAARLAVVLPVVNSRVISNSMMSSDCKSGFRWRHDCERQNRCLNFPGKRSHLLPPD